MYTCTLHMRNRKKSVQKLVKLSYDRRHLNLNLKLHSSPNVYLHGVKWWSQEVTHSWICTQPFPRFTWYVFNHTWVIIWTTVHMTYCTLNILTLWTSNYVLVIDTLLISYVNSSRIILFLKTLPVHAWACICHRWRDTSVGTTVGKMFPGDAHYEWI